MAKRRTAGKPPETKALVEIVSSVRHRVTCGTWQFEQDDHGDWMSQGGDGFPEWVSPSGLPDLKACVDAMHEIEQKNGGDESNG